MNALLEQINSIGKGFVEFAWPMLVQSSVLIVILLLVDFVLRKRVRAVFRYCIWMLVLVKLVLPSSLSSPFSFGYLFGDSLENVTVSRMTTTAEPVETVEMLLPMEMAGEGEARSVEAISMAPIAEPRMGGIEPAVSMVQVTWQGIVFLVWLAVVGAMGLLLLQRAVFVRGLVAQAKNANSLMSDAFRYCCGQMGMKRKVGLKVSAASSPAVCGLFRPVILVPQNLGPGLGSNGLRTVLLHELAHIKRRDLWVNLAQTVLQIIYFYNPLLWLVNAVIRRVREQAVDETVQVAMGERAQQYPETLVNVAKLAFRRPALSLRLIGVVESESALKGRIKRMLSRPIPRSAKLGILGLAAVLIIGAVLIPMATSAAGPAGFVIKGTVTDAETGQPIAGVKVGDVDEYADGRQWTITDSNGNYSYLTWYEEHGIKAEAPGYEIQHKGLYTKLFGSEKEKVLDFELVPNNSGFTATLSNGVTVELVGVCEHPSEGKQWWRPDGSLLAEGPYESREGEPISNRNEEINHLVEFAVRLTGEELLYTGLRYEVPGATRTSSSGGVRLRGSGSVKSIACEISKFLKNGEVHVGVAGGQWKTIATQNVGFARDTKDETDSGFITWGIAGEERGKSTVIVTHNMAEYDCRVVAEDKDGNVLKALGSSGGGADDLRTTKYTFGVGLPRIVRFRFQTRPYEWVEFKNVSLQPGVKSDVGVEVRERPSEDPMKVGRPGAIKKGKEEILAKLMVLSEQRERVQRELDYAERALQEVRAASGRTDLEERSYPHPVTSRLIRLEQERDNCHLEIAQLRANIKNLDERGAAEELENATDNLAMLEGKLEALDKMIEEAKEQKRDYDIARVEYKRRLAVRDERQLMLDSLKVQIEKLRMVYDEVEASEEQLEVARALIEKEGKDRKGEILAKLRALSEQRNRVQRELGNAERGLQEVRVASGLTDLEERSYRHPITERLMRLEQERDNCVLEMAQLNAKIKNLQKRGAAEELENATDNLVALEDKLEALNRMVQEAKARKRDLDLARIQYKQRARIRDERQVMLDSLKAQIEKLRLVYDEAERAPAASR